MSGATQIRLFVAADLSAGVTVETSREQAHYLRSVMRLQPGARLRLFNGRGGEWEAELSAVSKTAAALSPVERVRDQYDPPALRLMFSPLKKAKQDFLVQKAVELGATRLSPVISERTVVERVKEERLGATIAEAAEQCERLDLPVFDEPEKLPRMLENFLEETSGEGKILVCAESGSAEPLADILKISNPVSDNAILIGPEGGFSASEYNLFRQNACCVPVSLGPRVLRAETAGIAALSIWQSVLGDWGVRPPHRE